MNSAKIPNKFPNNGYIPVSSKALDANIINIDKPGDVFKELNWGTLGRTGIGALILAGLLRKKAAANSLIDLIKKNS